MKNKKMNGLHADRAFVRDTIRTAIPMLIFILCYFICFYILEHMTRLQYYVIHSPLDDLIPFCEYFVIPYYSWFVYMVVGAGILLIFDKENYRRTAWMLYLGMGLFIIVSALFPNILNLRPETMPRDNIFCRMVESLYSTDTPTNVAPSIHVYNTLTILAGLHHSSSFAARNRVVRAVFDIDGVLIILSTMFIKQHSVYDVLAAFIMYTVLFIAIYHPELLPWHIGNRKLVRTEEESL